MADFSRSTVFNVWRDRVVIAVLVLIASVMPLMFASSFLLANVPFGLLTAMIWMALRPDVMSWPVLLVFGCWFDTLAAMPYGAHGLLLMVNMFLLARWQNMMMRKTFSPFFLGLFFLLLLYTFLLFFYKVTFYPAVWSLFTQELTALALNTALLPFLAAVMLSVHRLLGRFQDE